MAVKKEEEDTKQYPTQSEKPTSKRSKTKSPQIAFSFWAYFTLVVSLITFLFCSLSSFLPQNENSWFLSLPDGLRLHHSRGKTVKVHLAPTSPPIQIFAIDHGPRNVESVLIVHGFGSNSYSFSSIVRSLASSGVRAVAIDLPGSGFSDKTVLEVEERETGVLDRVLDVYKEIKEKGLFWGFDQLIETGQIPYEEKKVRVSTKRSFKPLKLPSDEIGRIIGQVIGSLGLDPVHLVLHDSALGAGAAWALENPGKVSSLTVIDSSTASAALPVWALEMPIVRELVLGMPIAYTALLKWCCSKSVEKSAAEAHRILLKGKDARKAVVGVGKGLNRSFDLGEWSKLEAVRDVPIQVLWSSSWSEDWIEEGRRVADAVPRAKFVMHSGGRWPQEDAADEIAEKISQFISSLPKSVRQIEEEPVPEHIQEMFDEANTGNHHDHDHHHHHHHHGHGGHGHHGGHDHIHAAGYMNAYGLGGHGWVT